MWRRQEGLDYWLNKTGHSPEPTLEGKGKEKLPGKVRFWNLKTRVQDSSLDIHFHIAGLDDRLPVSVEVKSGLGTVAGALNLPNRFDPENIDTSTLIHKVYLIETVPVLPLEFPDEENVQVHQSVLNIIPYCRRFRTNLGPVPVRIPATVQLRLPRTAGRGALVPKHPTIKSLMPQAYDLPIRRKSIDIETLPDSEKLGYLQEAEQKKGLPANKCELIAVFRHVPVEMISKLHFINDEKSIVYSISGGLKRSRTRIYDLMVIRDGSKEVHLVPHGTRNRMVGLN
ncbi:MAG: hypothetical protein JXR49_15665 [Acidobacteria bacterium]|nr:hypothetical protein [Acidobacteriota bacterium]